MLEHAGGARAGDRQPIPANTGSSRHADQLAVGLTGVRPAGVMPKRDAQRAYGPLRQANV